MIEVKNLTKYYGPHLAVDHVSFTIESGHVYGFLGPNGAGKSTTMNMITGCLAASEGSVCINGNDIFEDAVEAKSAIGYLPEIPPLYTEMTPREYLTFVARAKRVPKEELSAQVSRVIAKTQLDDHADRLIRNLSKGYRQRVGIAQAILGDPEVVILDEPTVGLDPIQIREIRDLIKELGRDHTVILSSHILQEISAVCDYVIMIHRGRIVADDTIENLTASYGANTLIKLDVRGSEKQLAQALKNVENIRNYEVRAVGSDAHADIVLNEKEDVREEIFYALSRNDLPILQMTSNHVSLEDVFLQLVESGNYAEQEPEETPEEKPSEPSGETEDGYVSQFSTKGADET